MAATMSTSSLGDSTGTSSVGSWFSEHRNEAIIGGFVILGAIVYLYEKHKSSGSTGSVTSALPTSGTSTSTPTTVTLPGGFSFTGSGQQAAGYVDSVLGSASTTAQYANPTTVTLPNGASYTGTQSGAASFLQSVLASEGTNTTTSGGTQPTSSGGTSSVTTVPSSDSTSGAAPVVVPNVTPTPANTVMGLSTVSSGTSTPVGYGSSGYTPTQFQYAVNTGNQAAQSALQAAYASPNPTAQQQQLINANLAQVQANYAAAHHLSGQSLLNYLQSTP